MKAVLVFVLVFFLDLASPSTYTMEQGATLQLQCPRGVDGQAGVGAPVIGGFGPPGRPGKTGPPGSPGAREPDSELRRRYQDKIEELEMRVAGRGHLGRLGSPTNPASSCKDIKKADPSSRNGLYHLVDIEGNLFLTYCDMTIDGGGWTLVSSVHENNMKGRCTAGDRWSSEQGNSADHPHGDGFWENRAIHGAASSATSDDYKNSGYFAMNATDIMIWHVPNDTPRQNFHSEAFLQYHTSTGFLQNYGGNLQLLFSKHFPMRSKQFQPRTDNGPAIPIVWDKGNNAKMVELTAPNSRGETDPGYVQFRAINYERNAFALCHGVRIKPHATNVEHTCIGSTSNNIGHANEENYCGDFAAKDWPGGWTSPQKMIESVVFIFYR